MKAEQKELYLKHSSKLYKGFLKQRRRQQEKPREVRIELNVAIDLPKNFKGEYIHSLEITNSRWNGMNLMRLVNSLYPLRSYGGMHSKFCKNKEGKVKLSRYGKKILKKKKAKIKQLDYENN